MNLISRMAPPRHALRRIPHSHSLILCSLVWLASACSYFAPSEPETFGDVQITLRVPAGATLPKIAAPQLVDRVLIIISEPESNENPNGREIVRREFLLGNERALRASLRVPLRKGISNCFVADALLYSGLDVIYTGQGFPCFGVEQHNASVEVDLETTAFIVSQPIAPLTNTNLRLNPIVLFVRDSTLTHFEVITDSVHSVFPATNVRSNFLNAQAFVFGDTSTVTIRAWRNLVFKGEVRRRFVYTGRKSDIFIAMTWNSASDFDLEVVNPTGRAISVSAPGDTISGTLIRPDADGFGPELFEWRQSAVTTQGAFTINARRSLGNLIGVGTVYVYLREGQPNQNLTIVPFDFKITDTPLLKTVRTFNWP